MFGYFCLLSVLLIVLVDVVFYIIVSNTLANQAHQQVLNAGKDIVAQVSYVDSSKILKASFLRYREEGIEAYLVSEEGEIVFPAGFEISENRIEELKSKLTGVKQGNHISYISNGFVSFSSRVRYGGNSCLLLVCCPLTIVRQTVTKLQYYLVLISVVALFLALFLSYNLSQKLTRGIKITSDKAVKLAKGDFSVSFDNADYRELAKLSDTLNYVRDEVKKSHDFQREILANVTHDLKTPLTMIKAYASMVQEISGDNPEKRQKHLQVIIDETDRLTGLVNDVLAVSKVNSKISEIHEKVFNLTEFLYGIINKFGYLKQLGYNLMVDIEPNRYTRADEEKIGQVIYNLLGNAVSYTGDDKTIYISLKSSMDGKRLKFSVRDTGKGISKEELPHIWERYYRSEESHSRPVKGTGLGLNIVKVILENHSFDFGVESKKGVGSTFWVDFPSMPCNPPDEDIQF